MIGTMHGKNLSDAGSLPWAAAAARALLITLAACGTVAGFRNIASACLAAKAVPDFELPAWKSTGVLCGDGCT